MCYDARQHALRLAKIEAHFGGISYDRSAWRPEHSISAFSNGKVAVLTPEKSHEVQWLYWGFVPSWAKNAKDGEQLRIKTPNCRADTLLDKIRNKQHSMFKPLVNNPCVILLDGFFEWHTLSDGKTKIPYYISMKDCMAFAVAGFTSTWHDFAEPERSYTGVTLCTTSANDLLGWIHNKPRGSEDFRMPAMLLPEEISSWMDVSIPATDRLQLAKPYPASEMEAYTIVNFKKKENRYMDGEEMMQPFDHNIPGIPLRIDGAELSGLLSANA